MRAARMVVGFGLTLMGFAQAEAETGHPPRTVEIQIAVTDSPDSLPALQLSPLPQNKQVALTSMWDDGTVHTNPSGGDWRMADELQARGWKGTHVWTVRLCETLGADKTHILAAGMEVGLHTVTHAHMMSHTKNRIFWEFMASKIFISALTQKPATTYGDAYVERDTTVDGEFYRTDLLMGRGAATGGASYLTTDFDTRHAQHSDKVFHSDTGVLRSRIDAVYASGVPGSVLDMWGHVRDPEFTDAHWPLFIQVLNDYGGRADTWYATWADVGSYMFLLHAAHLGSAQIGSNSVGYSLQLDTLPRDVQPIPLTLRINGTTAQLVKVSKVTVDGTPVAFVNAGDGVLRFDVSPFAADLYPQAITSTMALSRQIDVLNKLAYLPDQTNADLAASWVWTPAGDGYSVAVSILNNRADTLQSFSFQIFTSSVWRVAGETAVPATLRAGETLQNIYTISRVAGENLGGWTAFPGRIDYVAGGTPKTHFLYRDLELPVSPDIAITNIGPNCRISGKITGPTTDYAGVLTQAAAAGWTNLAYDPSYRPAYVNLWPIYFPNWTLTPGVRVLSSYINAGQTGAAKMQVSTPSVTPSQLTGVKFWLNGSLLTLSGGYYSISLQSGANRLIAVCDVTTGAVVYNLTGMMFGFYPSDGTTPLSGLAFSTEPPAAADFSGGPLSGTAPLTVTFTDSSTNAPTSWAWDFQNDGTIDSTARNPSYTYTSAGTYTVKLTATSAGGSVSLVKTNYITVAVPTQYTVTVDDNTTYQKWEGFGASSMFYEEHLTRMSEPARTEVYDLIFKDLGATILGIRPYSQFQAGEGAAYNWGSMASQRAMLTAAKARGVINKVWARISSPPGWMKDNGSAINGGRVLPQYYAQFAAYCRDYLRGMRDSYGFPIYAFSIFNEPGNAHPYETTTTTPEEFRDILKIVGADFDSHGLSAVKLMAPDSPMLNLNDNYTGRNYLAPIANDAAALGYLDIIAVHSYDDKAGKGTWAESRDAAAAAGRPIWQTEVCNLSANTQHDITGACWGSWWAHRALNIGNVTAWHWWQYYFPEDPTAGDSGLVEIVNPTTYHVHPRYYMFKQWAKNIKPGAVRVSASSNYADLHVTAFKDGSTVYIMATNYRYQTGAQNVTATFNCTSIAGNVGHIRTSETENYITQPGIVPSGNSFTVTIPALTVNTFIVTVPATPGAPVARFSAAPQSGLAPLTVSFTDSSTNTPTRWAWDFDGDGTDDSTAQNPSHTYGSVGTYTVKLTATNASGSGSLVLTNYITAMGSATTTTTTTTTTTSTTRSTTDTSTTTTTTLPRGQSNALDFAQIAVGGPYRSFLTLTNPGEAIVSVNVIFRQPSANPLVLNISGVSGSSRALTIPAKGFVRLTLEDPGPVIKTGWCQVFSSIPINGVLVYQLADNQGIVSEASVFPSPRALAFTLPVLQLGAESLTGLALAVVDSQPAQITLRFFRQDGVALGTNSLTLQPGSQVSRFVTEFIPRLAATQEGMLEITADRILIAVALLFQGNIFTTIPASPLP